jgi:predicted Zn finger-like uncharacterized protein/SLAP domain-containing protein
MKKTLQFFIFSMHPEPMIVECHSCAMRYHLDNAVLGSKGCPVRCTGCGHIWHQSPPPTKNMLIPRPEENSTNRTSFSLSTKRILMILVFVFFGMGSFFAGRQSTKSLGPWIDGWIELWGTESKKSHLEMTSFSFQSTEDGQVLCQGSLRNTSDQTIHSPKIMLLLCAINAEGKTTTQKKEHVLNNVQIQAGQAQPFSLMLPASSYLSITATTL